MSDVRVDVLGVGVSALDLPAAVERIRSWIDNGERHYVCVTGVHGVMESQRDPELLRIHNGAGMTTPDGMPLVWAGRYAGAAIDRVYGPDLMLAVLAESVRQGWSSFFFGGGPGVADRLADRLASRFPGLVVAGVFSPPFREKVGREEPEILEVINRAEPDLLWVGLGTPKQERWMAANVDVVHASAILGVGAAFDIHAGLLPQAPKWMRDRGLEWLFRLAIERKRLWRRYLVNNPQFIVRMLASPPRIRPAVPASMEAWLQRDESLSA